jgi:hypothetical protein
MGCCASLIPGAAGPFPKADAFFATPAARTNEPHLIDGLPTTLVVDAARIVASMRTTAEPSATASAAQRNDPAGIGPSQVLHLRDASGAVLATLELPPPRSFGRDAVLTDAAGAKAALLRTASTQRPGPLSSSSYHVYAAKPVVAGQAPTPDGWYLRAVVTGGGPGTLATKIFDLGGKQTHQSELHYGPGRYSLKTVGNEGVMLADSTNEKPKRHSVRVAPGADPALAVCVMYAGYLLLDEIFDDGYRQGAV